MFRKRDLLALSALLVAIALYFYGCATSILGTSKKISVTSNPLGAKIAVDNEDWGYTPLILELKKNKSHNIRVEKPGYNPLEIIIRREVSGALAISIVGNVFGMGAVGGTAGHLIGIGLAEKEEGWRRQLSVWGQSLTIGALAGIAIGMIRDISSGAIYTLTPADLSVSLTKIEGIPHPDVIVLDSEHFQNTKWIRIRLSD